MRSKSYLLTVLLLVLACNSLDRTALGLVLEEIKADLALSDTQLGLLSGIAFAFFYSIMGIPIARWADRGNRVTIIALTTALWSLAVALSGLARSFLQLLVIRVGVAVGEAGCIPPAHSLIADSFSRAERPRAVAVYMLGGCLSNAGYFLAGWLNQLYGWRTMFVLLGLPGLALAAVAALTLKEPRLEPPARQVEQSKQPSLRMVGATLWACTTFRHLLYSMCVMYFFGYGMLQWQPTFFVRSYGMNTVELGFWFTVTYGIGSVVGLYFGGAWASRFAADDEPRQLRVMAFAYAAFGICSALIYLSSNRYMALALVCLSAVGGSMIFGPLFAAIQTLVPARMRATSIALIYLFANLIGMGLGPLLVGALSDGLHSMLGGESLRYALLAMSPGYAWGAWHLWRGSMTVARDIDAARND